MMNNHRVRTLIGVLVVSVILGTSVCSADQYSIDLKRLVEMDEGRPLPEYKLDSVIVQEDNREADMPAKKFEVFIRFTDFGSVRLDGARQTGPSSGQRWQKGMTFQSGLVNLKDVKVAWIKNSPDLLIVAWVIAFDPLGTAKDNSHGFVIAQMVDRRAAVLLRGQCTVSSKHGVRDDSYLSFNAKDGILQEQRTRHYEDWASGRPNALARPEKDEGGDVRFVTKIGETILLEYQLADGKLKPRTASLIYHARERDGLHEIALFYLGPFAPSSVLLEANPDLAKIYEGIPAGESNLLEQELRIKVPVPEKWLIDRFARTNQMND